MAHRVGVIGFFSSVKSAQRLIPPGCELTALCDIKADVIDRCRAEAGYLLCSTDYRDLAASDRVDSVITFTPNETHRDIAVAMLRGGKHVFIEKPMGITLDQGREILGAEREAGRYVAVDLEMRLSGLGPTVKEIIDSGELGRIVQVDHDHYRGGWLHTTPSGVYRTKKRTSGLFKMEGIHHIDLARYWIGEIDAVQCFRAPNVLPHYEIPDNVTAIFWFRSGAMGRYTSSHTRCAHSLGKDVQAAVRNGHSKQWSIVGTKGSVLIDGWRSRITIFHFEANPPGSDSLKPELSRTLDYSDLADSAWFHDMAGARRLFLSRMAEGLPPVQRAADAFRSERIAYAADESSYRNGERIEIPQDEERPESEPVPTAALDG